MMTLTTALTWLTLAATSSAQFRYKHTQYETSPPVYPTPNITGAGGWDDALEKSRVFLSQLSLEEKSQMVTGTPGPCVGNIAPIPHLNFSGLCLQDGPLAIRQAVYASVFPAQLTAAASWDRELTRARGVQIAQEFKGKGSHVILGPVVGPIGRSPFGGRNWEGFSPDAYLSGVLVEETVLGMQSAGVQACTKHYIGNEQEIQRNPSTVNGTTVEAISSNIDDKTMHETYLWPFANALHAGTASIMCSYNRINGSYGCQNSKSLNGLLKEELGFQGYVMSDWSAVHTGVASIDAGLDMNMPGGIGFSTGSPSYWGPNLTTAMTNGTLDVSRLDDAILRIMTPYYFLNQDVGYPGVDRSTVPMSFYSRDNYQHEFALTEVVDVRDDHAKLIRQLGAAGTVLLKNTNNTLPLKKPMNIGVFGNDASDLTVGQYSLSGAAGNIFEGNYAMGTLPVGGGSGTGRYSYIVSPLEAIKTQGRSFGALVQYVTDNDIIAAGGLSVLQPSPPDVCVVFLKSWASEGDDRASLIAEWNSTLVVEQTAKVCPNTIVVLHGAAPHVLPWKDNANVTAILAAHMPGQETGNSIVDILWGALNPSGKLPYTIANEESDYAKLLINSTELLESTDPDIWQDDFTEGNLIDYKEFDAKNKSVAYEFGFGLSYTTFELSEIKTSVAVSNASRVPSSSAKIVPGGNVELWEALATVSATVTNTGGVDGATVPQLYITLPAEAGETQNVRALRGFDKVELAAGESATVEFTLQRRDLSYWDVGAQTWRLPEAAIGVDVGFSSRDLKLNSELSI
ncbi:avenacinase [Massarina eburnea CBS 473.64]|uniref:Probable beta-glucosidase G n=1 Tax=Massarina eburnea CBS 473.64 TaxID=1395130 RepID=A0A6A6S993_9PLEO|nr:avenacinase [Massarina eburnea CBS 473.64]